jgi:hypothetical protein
MYVKSALKTEKVYHNTKEARLLEVYVILARAVPLPGRSQ